MSFTHRSDSENTATGSSSLTITKPAGLTVGDLMVAAIGKDDDPAISSAPSGWTKVAGQNTITGNDLTSWLGYKVADSADVAASNFTWSGDTEDWSGIITAFIPSNVNAAFVAASTDILRENDVTPASNSLSTTSGNLLIGYCTSAQNDTGGLGTATAGYTLAGNPTTGSGNGDNGTILAYDLSGPGGSVTYEANNAESTAESHPYVAEFSDVAAPILEQKAFRFRDGTDTPALNANTNWGAALNVDLTGINVDSNYLVRLRILLENDSGSEAIPSTADYKLQYRVNAGTWFDIGAGTGVATALSGQYADGDATTQVIGSGTFVAGDGVEGSAVAVDRALGTSSESEHEWMVQLTSADLQDADDIDFRIVWRENVESYKTPNIVTQAPSIAVVKTPFGPQLTSLTSGSSIIAASSYDTASITPTGDNLILAAVDSTFTTDLPTEPTASGNGLTWVVVRTFGWDTSGTTRRLTLFRAMGSSPSTGAITFDFGGQSQTEIRWSIVEYADVDTGGTNGSAAVIQNVQDPAAVGSGTTIAVVLSAFADSDNATYGVGVKEQAADNEMVGDSNMTDVHEVVDDNSDSRMIVQERDGREATVNWDWTTSRRRVGFALEIATTTGPSSQSISPVLEQSLATLFDLSLSTGPVSVDPILEQSIAVTFDPSFSMGPVSVVPDFFQQLALFFDPSLSTGPVSIDLGLSQSLALFFDPVVSADALLIDLDLLQQLASAFSVSLQINIQPALTQILAQAIDPSLTYKYDIDPDMVTSLANAFDPSFIMGEVVMSPDLVDSSAISFSPDITTSYLLAVGIVDQTSVTFDLVVNLTVPEQFISLNLEQQLVVVFSPELSNVAYIVLVAPSRLSQAFGLTIDGGKRGGKMMTLKDKSP